MMTHIGSLLDDMSSARNALFPDLVRTRADGTTYIECMATGCKREAVDPQLHCETHFNEKRREQQRKLELLDSLPPEQRRARRRLANIESVAKRLAHESGNGDRWRPFLKRAAEIIDAPAKRQAAKAEVDDVF